MDVSRRVGRPSVRSVSLVHHGHPPFTKVGGENGPASVERASSSVGGDRRGEEFGCDFFERSRIPVEIPFDGKPERSPSLLQFR
jgi:hypothetical protein